ncbi:MAG: response regulator [Deltaproteobacteria bacterium]|nr:response regulator [Deltaproteobacteria bacterium]
MNILIVDDHEENMYLLEAMLKGSGHEVRTAANGAEALEKLKTGGVDLIISDILMPVTDGYQLCRKVKTDETLRHIPFIIYTATYTSPQDEAFAMKIGADRFIQKPCEPDVFMNSVEEVMAAAGRSDRAPTPEQAKEEEILKLYSKRLVRKLEQKMLQAEREIQARQEAEEALRISNTRLRLALASADIGLWDWNLENSEVWFSPEWKRQIGYDNHEIPNRYEEWEKRLHPEDHPRILAEVDAYLQGRRSGYYVEFRLRHKDGTYRWIAASGKLIEEMDKKSKRFIGCHMDITERKRAEAERERLMAAIEQAGEVVFITDADGTIEYVNPVFETVTGYTYEEAVGKNPRVLLKSGKQDQAFYQDLWGTITAGNTWKGRMINKRKDGKLFTEDATISPVCDASGRFVNYVAVKRDITEHLQLEAQLFQAQKMESVGRLAGGVAHDYNNMLSIIIGYSELAIEKVDPSDSLYNNLEEILTAAKRSANITRQLLAFARQQTVAPKVLDLNEIVESMLKMLRRLIGEDIDLAWLPGAKIWPVKVDPTQVDQILANLCVNARDAIKDVGKVTIETKNISLDEEYCADHAGFIPGDYVLLAVSDDGSGMEADILDKVFEPYFTTKGLGQGTGLGLATVYGIIKQNNGFINIYSELGKGTTNKVYLPRHMGGTLESYEESVLEIPLSRGETLLLVEDEVSILKIGKSILESLGYSVITATTPSEAMGLAERNKGVISLLITDVVLPEMNGRDLADQLQRLYPNFKTLFISGYTSNTIAHRGILEEGVCFLLKPFSRKDLAIKVREALGNA